MSTDPALVDERARQLAADPTLNIALEASAGTGKTRVLVDRYVRLVEEGASPRHILAITFTRKAAGEMRSRIIDELRSRASLWKDLRHRLFEIHIETIDAFCLGLLREFPLEAGLDPDIKLIDEVDRVRLLQMSIDHALSGARRGAGPDARFLMTRFGESALRRGVFEFLSSRLLKESLLRRYVKKSVPPSVDLSRSLRRFAETLAGAFGGPEGVDRFVATVPDALVAVSFAVRRAADPDTITAADIESVAAYFLTRTKSVRKRLSRECRKDLFDEATDYETHRDRTLALSPFVAGAYRQWLREKDFYAIRELWTLYTRAAARFETLKTSRAALDFTDVLIRAVALLEKRGEFSESRFRLESRYHHLLIDEFQDTNEVQWRLVQALIASWGEGQGLVQETILAEQAAGSGTGKLAEPTLFLVGDRKQSIYGFRDARVEILDNASRRLLGIRKKGGRRLSLSTSFRASGELLSFLNDFFDELPKVERELEWSFQYEDGDHFPIAGSGHQSRPVGIAVGNDVAEVANAVADEVVRVLTEEGRRPKDVAILFRSRSSYRVYEEALARRGVPTYVYRGLGFFDSPEVRDLAALVRFLAEPASELRAAELSRSRFVSLADESLVKIASGRDRPIARWLSSGKSDALQTLPVAERKRAARAAERVPRWVSWVDRMPPADLLERILADSDYALWFRDEEQSWENLKKILEMVRRAQNRGYLTLSRLADYLESASTEDESEAVLEAVDAVNLMTVHAAKGLEYDTVFLVNLHKHTRRDTSLPRIREFADGRIGVSALAAEEPSDEPNRIFEEEKRLLYVAMTRARRNLNISSVIDPSSESDRSLLRLLPDSMKATLTEALDSKRDELAWKRHRVRVLRATPSPTGDYLPERPETSYRLALEPSNASTAPVLISEPSAPERAPLPLEALRDIGEVHAMVPFTFRNGPRMRRGTFDAIAVGAEVVTVLYGEPVAPSSVQLALRAARALFPEHRIEGRVFDAGGGHEEVALTPDDEPSEQLPLF